MPDRSATERKSRISPEFQLNLEGAFIPRTNLRRTNLAGANLSGADCRFVDFTGSNMQDTILKGTKLQGANLTDVANLTWEQLDQAYIDGATILPEYLLAERAVQ